MNVPSRPKFQQQGPADNCVIGGKNMGWLSCTSYATAMGIDKATLGVKVPTGCAVRRLTGDTVGGTNLPQNAAAAEKLGVKMALHVGSNVGSTSELAGTLHLGKGCVVQGGTKPVIKTKWRSTTGAINHAVYVNEVRGGTTFVPAEALVYDPSADARRAGIDQGPSWWPWSLVVDFAAALQPWGESDPRVLGKGRAYFGAFPDTEPHVHIAFGGKRTSPNFPDRTRAAIDGTRVHSRPDTSDATVVDRLAKGELFEAWQTTVGPTFQGSRVWYGKSRWRPLGPLQAARRTREDRHDRTRDDAIPPSPARPRSRRRSPSATGPTSRTRRRTRRFRSLRPPPNPCPTRCPRATPTPRAVRRTARRADMDLSALTPETVLTIGGASVVISILVGVIIAAWKPTPEQKDRFGPLLALATGLVVVLAFGALQGNADYASLLLTGILAGGGSMGVHDTVGVVTG